MIYSEDPIYGWGIGGIPMPREKRGRDLFLSRRGPGFDFVRFARDLPWRSLAVSVLLTLGGLFILLSLERHLPPILNRPETAAVKISVRFRDKAPELPPAPAARPQAEPVPAPRVERLRPPVQAKPLQPEEPLPPPVATRVVQEPEMAKALPADPPPPSLASYERTPRTAAEPLRAADRQLRLGEEEAALLPPPPDLRPRGGASGDKLLPAAESVALGRPAALDLMAGSPGESRQRYQERSSRQVLPEPASRHTLEGSRPREAELGAAPSLDRQRFQERAKSDLPLPAGRSSTAVAGPKPPEVSLPLPAGMVRSEPADDRVLPAASAASFDFLDRVAAADLDRLHMVSLNRLRTCLDPQEEMMLRTRLATLLSRAGTCRSGGVVFAISQPESAWSIHVDIYNYEKRELQDRCAALRLAVNCCQARR